MRILIVGGTGFLSSALVAENLAAGHEVTIVTRGRRPVAAVPAVQQIVADRADQAAFRAAVRGANF